MNENISEKRSFYTWVVLNQLLQRVKLSPGGDVVAATVQLADLIMLDVVSFHIVPVSYGQGEGPWGGHRSEMEGMRSEWLNTKNYKLLHTLTHSYSESHRLIWVCGFTLCGFTLPNEIGASWVSSGQQLPLCIFTAQFTKVPAAITGQNMLTQTVDLEGHKVSALHFSNLYTWPAVYKIFCFLLSHHCSVLYTNLMMCYLKILIRNRRH